MTFVSKTSRPALNKPRRWWIALLLAPLGSALAYFYVGRPHRALLAFGLTALAYGLIWHGLGGTLTKPHGFAVFSALLLFGFLAMTLDAVRIARVSPHYEMRWCNRWWAYLGIAGASLMLGEATRWPWFDDRSIRTFSLASGSGEPNLRLGEVAVADMGAYRKADPRRGDLVIARAASGHVHAFRIMGLPGERVQMRGGKLVIDGAALASTRIGLAEAGPWTAGLRGRFERETLPEGKSIVVLDTGSAGFLDDTAEIVVPAGHYFLLGDNRDNAADSRLSPPQGLGTVARADIKGRLETIVWPSHWNRMLMPVE